MRPQTDPNEFVKLVAGITELAGVVITAIGVLGIVFTIVGGGYVWEMFAATAVSIIGLGMWWAGKEIQKGNRRGVIPLLLGLLATTPIDLTDPITAGLELLALLAIAYIYKETRTQEVSA